ncbi:MAG TPA: hypothetical protein DCG19_07205 [Cryomorphaceae bacterium]|nr:hypothetical protein [Owenweeksia sp.]MBF97730.1 hypothetical protein [Owenweeksia sp.]HAD97178.1 hypothetical protein [Cryomorphaceae bacterium]HBF19200.1 hypothetical protein [Cryomorphaceae bacterium]HCQ16877.1 hypothetical protein [Cryomorphaceae bacterium]
MIAGNLSGQKETLVYLDIAGEGNRTSVNVYLDSLYNNWSDKQQKFLVFLSRGGTPPVVDVTGEYSSEIKRVIRTAQNISLPNPNADLDTILKLSDKFLKMDGDVELYFFFGAEQVTGYENHIETILERILLTHGLLMEGGKLKKGVSVKVFIDALEESNKKTSLNHPLRDKIKLYDQYQFTLY